MIIPALSNMPSRHKPYPGYPHDSAAFLNNSPILFTDSSPSPFTPFTTTVLSLDFIPCEIWISDFGVWSTYCRQYLTPSHEYPQLRTETTDAALTSLRSFTTALFASPSRACAATHSSMTSSETERTPSLSRLAPGLTWH